MKEFATAEWQRAQRMLASARQLADTDPDSSASRAYYAAFHALTALFALRHQTYTKHSAIRAALHRELIQTGQLDVDMGRAYDLLMDLRETGDYGGLAKVTSENAQTVTEKAQAFLEAILAACPEVEQDP